MRGAMIGLFETAFLLVTLVSSIWIFLDARALGVRKGQVRGLANMGPTDWLLACLIGGWIFAVPLYLAKRGEFKAINRAVDRSTPAHSLEGREETHPAVQEPAAETKGSSSALIRSGLVIGALVLGTLAYGYRDLVLDAGFQAALWGPAAIEFGKDVDEGSDFKVRHPMTNLHGAKDLVGLRWVAHLLGPVNGTRLELVVAKVLAGGGESVVTRQTLDVANPKPNVVSARVPVEAVVMAAATRVRLRLLAKERVVAEGEFAYDAPPPERPPRQEPSTAGPSAGTAAAIEGPAGTQVFTLDRRWVDEVSALIRQAATSRPPGQGGQVTLTFEVGRSGEIRALDVAESSGDPALDKWVLDAVMAAAPLPTLPVEVPGEWVQVGLPLIVRVES
jgi:TonB family protein